jgi:hypothetical protein
MPIIDEVKAVLPDNLKRARGEVFIKEIIRAGNSLDNRPLMNDEIRSLFNDTKTHFMEKGIVVKVKIGHFQEGAFFGDGDQELKGFVKEMALRRSTAEDGKLLSIWASLHLFPEVASKFKEGRFIEVSIGRVTGLKDDKSNDIENVIEHVALLGAERAALPHLKSALKSIKRKIKEVRNKMPTENKTPTADDMLRQAFELFGAYLGEKVESEEKKEESQEDDSTERAIISPIEATKAFNELVSNGNISPDNRDEFDSLLDKTRDLDYAKTFYNNKSVKKPLSDQQEVKSDVDEEGLKAKFAEFKSIGEKMGLSEEKTKELVEGGV